MKKILIIISNLLIAQLLFGQIDLAKENVSDPFCHMINTIYSLDELSFNSQYNIKQVFEIDTITTNAKVILKKKGTDISFLNIITDTGDQELLFCHDSAWVVSHEKNKMSFAGTNTSSLAQSGLSQFFSFTLFDTDTTISQVEPFWRVISVTDEYTVISLDINNSSPELSDIRVEFTIGNSDNLPYKTFQESVYMKADKFFQEQIFSGYSFPDPEQIMVPEYYSKYEKDFSIVQKMNSVGETKAEKPLEEIFLQDIELYDLHRKPFSIPDKGLIFLDLWYVGCSPCMKSAPVIEKLYNEYKDRVHFFSINETDQDTAKIVRFKDKMGISFPVLLGGKEKLALKVNGSNSYPLFLLMDGESRKILWKQVGYNENMEELIKTAIKQNL